MSLALDNRAFRLSRQYLAQCSGRLDWEQQKLNDYKVNRLRVILAYAKKNSAWYKEKLAKIDINNFTEDRMHELPILTKSEFMSNWDSIITDQTIKLSNVKKYIDKDDINLNGKRTYQIVRSGGSSETPGIFIYDIQAWINSFNSIARIFDRDPFFQSNHKRKILKITIAAPYSGHLSHLTSNSTHHRGSHIDDMYLPVTQPYENIITQLKKLTPDILQGYPSILLKLAQSQKNKDININPKIIVSMGECLYDDVAFLLRKTWDAKIYNVWACGEIGSLAITCNTCNNLLLNTDHCLIEQYGVKKNLFAENVEVSDSVLLTGLHNRIMPLIRFQIDDQVIVGKVNPCCSKQEVISGVIGRSSDIFTYGNSIVHSYCFRSIFLSYPEVITYQIVQTKQGVCVRLNKTLKLRNHLLDDLKKSLLNMLLEVGIKNPTVLVEFVNRFDMTPSGKIKRFISMG